MGLTFHDYHNCHPKAAGIWEMLPLSFISSVIPLTNNYVDPDDINLQQGIAVAPDRLSEAYFVYQNDHRKQKAMDKR